MNLGHQGMTGPKVEVVARLMDIRVGKAGEWRLKANCRGQDFPEDTRWCEDCSVQIPCLLAAMEAHELGIWGGTNEDERVQLRAYLSGRLPGPGPCPECTSIYTVITRDGRAKCIECGLCWNQERP